MVQKNERVELEMKIMKDRGAMARRVTDTAPAFVGVMTSSYDFRCSAEHSSGHVVG
jgi:hypothetical protein